MGRVPYARGAREGALCQVVAKGNESKDLRGKGRSDWSEIVKCKFWICEQPRHRPDELRDDEGGERGEDK